MKKRLFVALVLALTLVALPVMSALAGDIFHFSGQGAFAFFSSTDPTDPSGCTGFFVAVFADDGKFQSPPGPGSTSSGAFVEVAKFDGCTGTLLMDVLGFASLAGPDFRVSRGLTSATLLTTIPAFDFVSGLPVDVDVALTWDGTGDLTRSNSHFHSQSPGFIVNGHFNGVSRFAEASGSVTIGGTNFTPQPSGFAMMMSTKSGTVIID